MKKYGVDNFYMEILERNVPNNNLDEREKYYIDKFNSFHNGYNETIGGEGESHVDHDLIIGVFNRGYSITEIHALTGYSNSTISSHIKGDGCVAKHYKRLSHARREKMNNGKAIVFCGKTFSSHKECAEYLVNNVAHYQGMSVGAVMSHLTKNTSDGIFVPDKKRATRKTFDQSYKNKSITFMGTHYESYKDLAIHLIDTVDDFKTSKVNTVIQGISWSIKNKKPYKSVCFY